MRSSEALRSQNSELRDSLLRLENGSASSAAAEGGLRSFESRIADLERELVLERQHRAELHAELIAGRETELVAESRTRIPVPAPLLAPTPMQDKGSSTRYSFQNKVATADSEASEAQLVPSANRSEEDVDSKGSEAEPVSSVNRAKEEEEAAFYGMLWMMAATDEIVNLADMQVFLAKSSLTPVLIGQIMKLSTDRASEAGHGGRLNYEGFCLACRLVGHAQAGSTKLENCSNSVPETLASFVSVKWDGVRLRVHCPLTQPLPSDYAA